MNEQDLRDCFAMFGLAGAVMRGEVFKPEEIWVLADMMLETRNKTPEVEEGIVAVKPKRRTK